MTITLRGVLRDGLLLLALTAFAVVLGTAAGRYYQKSSTRPAVESFDRAGLTFDPGATPVMIATSTCPACASARQWLTDRKVTVRELTVDQSDEARRIAGNLDVTIVPTCLIGGTRINGFVEAELAARLPASRLSSKAADR